MIEIKNELFLDRWAPLGSTSPRLGLGPRRSAVPSPLHLSCVIAHFTLSVFSITDLKQRNLALLIFSVWAMFSSRTFFCAR